MKTILRIIVILLVASAVAATFFVVVNNSTTTSSSEGGQPSAIASADGQSMPVMESRDGGSVAGGIAGVLVTLAKLTAITLVVLSLEKGLKQWNSRKWNWAQG